MAENSERMDHGMDEDDTELIELVDEDGNTETFELLGTFDFQEAHYLAVSEPLEDDAESVAVIFLKTVSDEAGNDTYLSVDGDEADQVYDYFLTLVETDDPNEE